MIEQRSVPRLNLLCGSREKEGEREQEKEKGSRVFVEM